MWASGFFESGWPQSKNIIKRKYKQIRKYYQSGEKLVKYEGDGNTSCSLSVLNDKKNQEKRLEELEIKGRIEIIQTTCNILICRCMQKHIQHNKDKRTQFLRKIYLSLYLKGFEKVTKGIICERWLGDWIELQHIDPHSSGQSSISFPFFWAAQPGAWGSSLHWDMVLIPASSL